MNVLPEKAGDRAMSGSAIRRMASKAEDTRQKQEQKGYKIASWARVSASSSCAHTLLSHIPALHPLIISPCHSPPTPFFSLLSPPPHFYLQGPVSICAVFWATALLKAASLDATCGPNAAGLSSGADGLQCTPNNWWNESHFRYGTQGANFSFTNSSAANYSAALGSHCEMIDVFGVPYYEPSKNPLCMQAYSEYRNQSNFTRWSRGDLPVFRWNMPTTKIGAGYFTCK